MIKWTIDTNNATLDELYELRRFWNGGTNRGIAIPVKRTYQINLAPPKTYGRPQTQRIMRQQIAEAIKKDK